MSLRTIDLFCGAGGSSWGAQAAGCEIVAGFDMNEGARSAYSSNFPHAKLFGDRLENLDPASLQSQLGAIDLLLASPECTNHSPAKGKAPRSETSRDTAFQVVRFAETFTPRWIVIENVVNMLNWHRYSEFKSRLVELGYNTKEYKINAADFGVAQTRKRLFVICDRANSPPEITPALVLQKSARDIIEWDSKFPFTPLHRPQRAKRTIERAERAQAILGTSTPYLMVYYGTDGSGGWQSLDKPLRTITTLDRFALVVPGKSGPEMRMLQVPELKAAMGMPKRFIAGTGPRREQIRAIGNGVCPPVMKAIIKKLLATKSVHPPLPSANQSAK
ncbi:DNA cytosine methyltransferase [Corallococcus sp. AB032C]|uniref:DNA cytosine methyltransferase n=1 Tax=Corallococcus TaxID=83461 RepID=UPI000EEE83A7|nr:MULTISPECIES: DNA cytosine methyltransferase [Corallococcus]NPC49883.1 DNA cytosine methyltransferase [Corallococcus exiguus]RKH77683.1 DNA cytosine methyltransferase [Corallococcus sp. AB032C]